VSDAEGHEERTRTRRYLNVGRDGGIAPDGVQNWLIGARMASPPVANQRVLIDKMQWVGLFPQCRVPGLFARRI